MICFISYLENSSWINVVIPIKELQFKDLNDLDMCTNNNCNTAIWDKFPKVGQTRNTKE